MKNEDKEYVRAFAAMFAMNGLLARGSDVGDLVGYAVKLADSLIEELEFQDTTGIAAIKPKKKYDRKA